MEYLYAWSVENIFIFINRQILNQAMYVSLALTNISEYHVFYKGLVAQEI